MDEDRHYEFNLLTQIFPFDFNLNSFSIGKMDAGIQKSKNPNTTLLIIFTDNSFGLRTIAYNTDTNIL